MILFCTLPTTVYPKHLFANLLHVPLTCLCKLILHLTSRTLCAVILSLSLQYFHSSTFYILKSFPSHSVPETLFHLILWLLLMESFPLHFPQTVIFHFTVSYCLHLCVKHHFLRCKRRTPQLASRIPLSVTQN